VNWLLLAAEEAPPLSLALRVPFSALHFLEFAIWGAWFVVLGQYLEGLKFSRTQIGRIYATMSLGAVFAPIIGGSIADRYFAAQHVNGVLHLVGAGLLLWMSQVRTPKTFYWATLAYALVYTPTLSLANSVVFAHLPDAQRDFPLIRVFGTIGWIVAGLALKLLLKPNEPVNNRPLLLAAALSLVLGVLSFFLPNTPPAQNPSAVPFLDAVGLLKEPSFGIFFGVSFLITIALAFYYSFTSLFLEQEVRVRPDNVGPIMTLGQWVELGVMFTLSWFLAEFGMKWVLVMGMAAWGIRYGIFAASRWLPLVLIGVGLHGVCFDFFFAAGFIHVENTAPAAIRNSAQSLFGVLTYGLGMYLGTELSGWLNQALTREVTDPQTGQTRKVTNWRLLWLVPCIGVLVSLALFLVLFQA
jgi:nucleoside transporter